MQPSRRVRLLTLLLLCLLGGLFRSLKPFDVVFPGKGKVHLLDTDSYDHLRHARYCLHHFPLLSRSDPLDNYPAGARSDAAGLFDSVLAGAARIAGFGRADEGTHLVVCALAPVVLSVLTMLALYLLAREWLSPGRSLAVVALYLAYPGEALPRGMLGEADHHIAEILLSLLVVWGFARTVAGRMNACVGALPLLGLLFTWSGGPLYIAILGRRCCHFWPWRWRTIGTPRRSRERSSSMAPPWASSVGSWRTRSPMRCSP